MCALVSAIVYVISPVDVLPDTLGMIGIVDDFAVLVLVAVLIAIVLRQLAVDAGRPAQVAAGVAPDVN